MIIIKSCLEQPCRILQNVIKTQKCVPCPDYVFLDKFKYKYK